MSEKTTKLQGIMDEFEHECYMLRVEASETRARDDVVRKSYERIRDEFAGRIAATLGSDNAFTREEAESAFVRGYSLGSLPVGSDPQWDENRQTVDEHMAELGWVRAATLGNGTLTAEQVRECVQVVYFEGYSDGSVNRGQHLEETDWQAIADELNAKLEEKPRDRTEEWLLNACNQATQDYVTQLERERDEWKTKCETREFAYKQADAERKRYSEQIDELLAERDEWKAFSGRLETAAHDKLGVTLFGIDYVTEDFMLHVRDTLTAERDELQRELDIANAKLAGKPECDICDRTTLLEDIEGLERELDQYHEQVCGLKIELAQANGNLKNTTHNHAAAKAKYERAQADAARAREKQLEAERRYAELLEKPPEGAWAERIGMLEAENAELREKLGEAIGHAHEIGKLVDLEARAAS